jgi:hypothetical protein
MLTRTSRAALLCSAAAFAFSTAHAQQAAQQQVPADADPQACVVLAERLAADPQIDPNVRAEVEGIISTGDVAQCHVVFTTWEQEGAITQEGLQVVAREQVTERMIVQQEVEVEADAAVYQPPPQIDIETDAAEIIWTMPRQSVTIDEQAPQITVRQARPTVHVEVPQPRVTVMIPEPEVLITWPDPTMNVSELQPNIEVRIPEPRVSVTMPDPIVELTIGGSQPSELVELDDGRFAPAGATDADLQPQINVTQQEAMVTQGGEMEAPEIHFQRGEPIVTFEGEEPEVTVQVVGEPEIQVTAAPGQQRMNGATPEAGQQEQMQQEQPQQQQQMQEQPQQPEAQQQPGAQPQD